MICLGCGCTCDDIGLVVRDGTIVEARNACALGLAWFGDGRVPARALVHGREAPLEEAIGAVAGLLKGAARPLVYLAPDLTCEAQKEAIAVADRLRGSIDSVTSLTASASVLAAQEQGRAGATLGEIRNRADVLVLWGVDPEERYPRYRSRYAPDQRVIAVEDDAAPAEDQVLAAIGDARYVVVVADGESPPAADLVGFTQRLNGTTRAALSTLRGGGNRSGADACLTSQTGYPMSVDFSRGFPRYRPFDGTASARLARGEVDALLVVGAAGSLPLELVRAIAGIPHAVIGPRASDSPLASGAAAIDTGVPGIHEAGTVLRMDDVPLPVATHLDGPPDTRSVLRSLGGSLGGA